MKGHTLAYDDWPQVTQHDCLIDPVQTEIIMSGKRLGTAGGTVYGAIVEDDAEGFQEIHPLDEPRGDLPGKDGMPCHLQNLAAASTSALSTSQQGIVRGLLKEFSDVFARSGKDLGCIAGYTHSINVGDHPPIRQAPRRIAPHRLEEVDKLIQEMEDTGVIEPSQSPWASPIVLVPKKMVLQDSA